MRIVVIENDEDFRRRWVALLESHGHVVTFFESINDRSAKAVHQERYDLALVDRRARDDRDEGDTSGQVFAVELCQLGTPTVLLTGFHPSGPELFDLLRTSALTGVAPKKMDMGELAACVDEFGRSQRFPNCIARFRWHGRDEPQVFLSTDWDAVRERTLVPDATREDCAVLFRSLIPTCATDVDLDPIPPGHGGATLFRARVSSGDGPVVEEVAIKFGRRATIRSEATRYDRHVGPLPDGVAAHLRWRKETRSLAAIAYSWVGDSVTDGMPFGPVRNDKQVLSWRKRRAAIEKLFSVSLNPWYTVYRSDDGLDQPVRLFDYYRGPDGDGRGAVPFADGVLPVDCVSPVRKDNDLWDFGPYGQLPDPAAWIAKGRGASLTLQQYSPVHGDLHVKNIYVMADDSPRLIDFGDTSLGHVFRDFAALETSVRMSCGNCDDLDLLKLAADRASTVSGLGEHIDYRAIPNDRPDLRHTLVTTMQIRRAALDAVGVKAGERAFGEYLFSLVWRMLRYAEGLGDEMSPSDAPSSPLRTWFALYCAAKAAALADTIDAGAIANARAHKPVSPREL